MMLGNLADPRGLAAVLPPQIAALPAVDPSSLAQSMGNLLPPSATQAAPASAPAAPAPIPGGNLMPPPPPVPRPNLLPPSADPTPNAPPMVPATAHAPPVDRKQAATYFLNAANQINGAFR